MPPVAVAITAARLSVGCGSSNASSVELGFNPLTVDPNNQLAYRDIHGGRSAGAIVGPAFALMAFNPEADVVA